ncbi:MAG TPA: hypothetical protein VIV57_26575 [Anaeromyxobacter sp.]
MEHGAALRRMAASALLAAVPGLVRASVPLDEMPIASLGRAPSNAAIAITARGAEFDVDDPVGLLLPLPRIRVLELDLAVDAPMLVSFLAEPHGAPSPGLPRWRYRSLSAGPTTLGVDLAEVPGWSGTNWPALRFEGAGHVIVSHVRVGPPVPSQAAARGDVDRAALWSSDPVWHTSINAISPPFWSASNRTYLSDVIAAVAAGLFVAVLAGFRLARGSWRPGAALAAAALLAVAAHGIHAAIRFLPAWNLSPKLDPEARIRDNYGFVAQFGPLAALARSTIGPGERVGVVADANDWFGPQTLCFHLAPRRCVAVRPGEAEHRGISGIGTLRDDQIDVLVSYDAPELPPGFVPVAAVSRRAFVARRK